MGRLTTDIPNGNFETMLNFVYGKDGWGYIRHDGEHADVRLTAWAKRQCMLCGCDDVLPETPEEIDQRLFDCMMEGPICPIAMAYCFASQAVHLRNRLKMYEDAMPLEQVQELAQAEKDGRLVVLPCKVGDTIYVIYHGRIVETKVRTFFLGHPSHRVEDRDMRMIRTTDFDISMDEVGKHIFLSCEEAEAALKKKGGRQ